MARSTTKTDEDKMPTRMDDDLWSVLELHNGTWLDWQYSNSSKHPYAWFSRGVNTEFIIDFYRDGIIMSVERIRTCNTPHQHVVRDTVKLIRGQYSQVLDEWFEEVMT